MDHNKFSVVIPAHNEEKYITRTLRAILSSDYPSNKFEVIVAENGSKDKTFATIKKIKSKILRPFSMKRSGISLAKNYGASKASKDSDWIIFLDADVIVEKEFLKDLNDYLNKNKSKNFAIGTVRLYPVEKGFGNEFWFWFCATFNKYFKKSASIQIAKKEYFDKVKYDENLKLLEDMELIRRLRKFGKFFFFSSKTVKASARRFQKFGGFKLIFQWGFIGILPYRWRTKHSYEVIR